MLGRQSPLRIWRLPMLGRIDHLACPSDHLAGLRALGGKSVVPRLRADMGADQVKQRQLMTT
jgi:hypothetical protein